ncbi:hypothetical protein U5801_17670 [Lamprobacter modestohalophilus]|uniref:hypothetical protein n=1 Tax=Lamprobacter modestohalophilus TaxID=1064514 RepID=UPI002ADEF5AC|nr:hypothetical protein [Lamprobacter modestohalophilus]MEA1051619.1 hypothetical protein [Lamprobacter modestohalophilus]
MTSQPELFQELSDLFLEVIPAEYPKHMLCYFAGAMASGHLLPFTLALLEALCAVEAATPGYAAKMLKRIGAIKGTGETQYEALLQNLAEIYVTSGLVGHADRESGRICFTHEPSLGERKNPECELRINQQWVAVEVKTPCLIQHGRLRTQNPWQLNARLPGKLFKDEETTRPRDNPVKDFLLSANEKFRDYKKLRADAYHVLVIIWDDYCNEPIAALLNTASGLLTERSFFRDEDDKPVEFPHLDSIVIIRHQHQLTLAMHCEPLVDGLKHAFDYQHQGFPPKAVIQCPNGRLLPPDVLSALNATHLNRCLGAEYNPGELVMWV